MKLIDKFIVMLPKLEPIEFAGLAKNLKVNLYDNQKNPKDFSVVFEEVISSFNELKPKKQKEFFELVKASTVGKK